VIAHESSGSEDSIVVRWLEEGSRITVEVEDRVAPAAAAVEDSQGFSSREVMSLALLESLVDSSETVEVPGGGSKVRLVVARS
jgi:hypothetical protein